MYVCHGLKKNPKHTRWCSLNLVYFLTIVSGFSQLNIEQHNLLKPPAPSSSIASRISHEQTLLHFSSCPGISKQLSSHSLSCSARDAAC